MGTEAQGIAVGKQRVVSTTRLGQHIALLLAFVASVAIGYSAYERFAPSSAPASPILAARVQRGSIAATVSTTGSVVPNKQSKLTFAASGTISQVMGNLGDKVKSGQVLAKLDSVAQEIKLGQAKSSLRSAQIKLDSLRAGGTPDEIQAAKAALASAQARYDDLAGGATDADLKSTEQAVASAQAGLTKAQADLAKLKAGPTQDEITVAKADLEKKQAALVKAQADYDKIAWRGDVGARPEAVALQQATADYQASLANYNIRIAPPKPEDLDAAQKNVESATAALGSAQAKLDQLRAGPKDADLQASQSAIVSARAQLALAAGPPNDLNVAALQEEIKQAELSVRQAESDLAKSSLTAPFDGVVAAVNLNPGEQTSANSYLTMFDPSSVRVDVSVDETDLSKLSLGNSGQVTFDALPDTRLPAKVIAISPSANVQQGVVTYMVSLQLGAGGVYLPAGMTANVSIVIDQKDNVLLAPNRAVRTQGRTRVVEVLDNGKPETRQVTIGMNNDQMTEVTAGLEEGEQVIIRSTSTAPPRTGTLGGFGGGMAPGGGGIAH